MESGTESRGDAPTAITDSKKRYRAGVLNLWSVTRRLYRGGSVVKFLSSRILGLVVSPIGVVTASMRN